MATEQDELIRAQAEVERAWERLNETHHGLPDCEHVRAWRDDLHAADQTHQRALRARDKAYRARYPEGPPEGGTDIL